MSEAVHMRTSFSEAPPQIYHSFFKDDLPAFAGRLKT
jgi:hypothetical protein